MDLRDTPAQAAFRREVRDWLAANLPSGWGTPGFAMPETGAERVAFGRTWQRRLHEGGWAGLDWPREYGGRGASASEQLIFSEEYAAAGAPDLIMLSVGTSLVGPTLVVCGADWQKERFLAPILRGEEIWCQGFSEPGAGSDLASLRTRGEIVGDEIVVTGQKIWTSFAQHAQWCIAVVRTDPNAVRHRGLSFLLIDMATPGITIRPLVEMTGEAWFNEVFFDEVRVPLRNVVGTVDQGWDVVLTTLSVERGSSAAYGKLARDFERLVELAKRTSYRGRPAAEDPVLRQKLAQYATELEVLRMTSWRNAAALERDGQPGPEGSTLKLAWSELDQRVRATAIEILGHAGLIEPGDPAAVDDGFWSHELLWSRAATIYAGTSEVQRNILAHRVLGLPR
ncbi:MAG: acyl-CoA dehydrogenase family protein [Myxococcota bacterium]|nr:acyl-CoA dehydrogenase family protein [Myxococcota bacterium]